MASGTRPLLAGWLMALMIALAIAHGLLPAVPAWLSGLAGWSAAVLLWPALGGPQRKQAIILTGIGLLTALASLWYGSRFPWSQMFSQNHALLSMITAVSFIRLVAIPAAGVADALPSGPRAFRHTLFGLHAFGAVINISAMIIIGDRLTRDRGLDRITTTVLSRGFSTCAFWSPFFAAMATVLTYSPHAQLLQLMLVGIPLALCGMFYTIAEWSLRRGPELATFGGYPIRLDSLLVPGLLGAGVLSLHFALPGASILILIASLSLVITMMMLILRTGPVAATRRFAEHIGTQLPSMRNELFLFLGAGVLATGLDTLLPSLNLWLPFSAFTAATAWLTLVFLVALAVAGIHPIIMVSTVAIVVAPLHPDPSMLAMVFLMSWAIGVTVSPLSGQNVLLASRYNVNLLHLMRWNSGYSLFMLALCAGALQLYVRLAG